MKEKIYKIYIHKIPVVVKKEVYEAYWKSIEHEKYLQKKEESNPSLDQVEDGYSVSYIECKYLENTNPTQDSIDTILLQDTLNMALAKLKPQERKLIEHLYYRQQTEREIAAQEHVQQSTIARRKQRILKKLKKFLENM